VLQRAYILRARKRRLVILDDLSGALKPGRLTLLLGPPSSGKTTLLKALCGALQHSGLDVSSLRTMLPPPPFSCSPKLLTPEGHAFCLNSAPEPTPALPISSCTEVSAGFQHTPALRGLLGSCYGSNLAIVTNHWRSNGQVDGEVTYDGRLFGKFDPRRTAGLVEQSNVVSKDL